jgi:hypothetical protein
MHSSSHLISQLFEVYGQFCKSTRVELNLQCSFIPLDTNIVLPTVTYVLRLCSFLTALVANIIPILLAYQVTVSE